MDLVDEEDRALRRVGQEGHDVHLLVEGRPARDVQLDPQLVVQDRGEGRLAQPGRTVEEDVGQRLAALLGRGQADRQPLGDGALADHLGQALRAELLVDRIGGAPSAGRLVRTLRRARPSPPGSPLIVGSRIDRPLEPVDSSA